MHCLPLPHGLARLLLGIGLASAAVAAPARAETVSAMESAPTALSAYGGRVAWWSVDPGTHLGRLMTWVGAHPQRVHIAPVRKAQRSISVRPRTGTSLPSTPAAIGAGPVR